MLIFKKEKEARKLVLGHLDEVQACLHESRDALEAYVRGDHEAVQDKRANVSQLESSADSLVRDIRAVLLDGAFLPQIRSDVFRLVGCVDAIANKAEGLSRFIADQPPQLPDDVRPHLLVLYQHSLDSFAELRKGLRDFFKPKGVLDNLHVHVTRVMELESEVDEMESAMMRQIFASSMDLSEKMHLEHLVRRIATIADLSEDAADELEFAAMKSVI